MNGAAEQSMDIERIKSRFLCRFSPTHRRAIRTLVTPFTPYLIGDFFLSREIFSWGLRSLNPRSRDLRRHAGRVAENDRVYCQSDFLPELVTEHLPRIRHPFVLITGKWQLPAVKADRFAEALLRSDKVRLWFSQNLPVVHPKCRPFPYGICHHHVRQVLEEMSSDAPPLAEEIYFGFVGVHDHLPDDVKQARRVLESRMEGRAPLGEYLRKLHASRFVASPRGDRPDTYRHWEAIALGCVPIADVPRIPFEGLFGTNMIIVDRMADVLAIDPRGLTYSRPDVRWVEVAHWRDEVSRELHARFRAPPCP